MEFHHFRIGSQSLGTPLPRSECAAEWRKPLLAKLGHVRLTLVLGQYAQQYHFGDAGQSLTDLAKNWRTYWPDAVPMPHPSPRNNLWLRRNPWFALDVLPKIRERVRELLA